MKLLSKTSAHAEIKKENEVLIDTNIRLRKIEKEIRERLNTIKEDYAPDKVKRLQEFERFCKGINDKKSKLLEELSGIEIAITKRKELYYGLVEKQDLLDEKLHNLKEKESKLDLRVAFVEDLEKKWEERSLTT